MNQRSRCAIWLAAEIFRVSQAGSTTSWSIAHMPSYTSESVPVASLKLILAELLKSFKMRRVLQPSTVRDTLFVTFGLPTAVTVESAACGLTVIYRVSSENSLSFVKSRIESPSRSATTELTSSVRVNEYVVVPETQSVETVYPLSEPSAANARFGTQTIIVSTMASVRMILRIDMPISSSPSNMVIVGNIFTPTTHLRITRLSIVMGDAVKGEEGVNDTKWAKWHANSF